MGAGRDLLSASDEALHSQQANERRCGVIVNKLPKPTWSRGLPVITVTATSTVASAHLLLLPGRWSDLQGGGSGNTVINQSTHLIPNKGQNFSRYTAVQSNLRERPSSTHYAVRHRTQSAASSTEGMTRHGKSRSMARFRCLKSACIGPSVRNTSQ